MNHKEEIILHLFKEGDFKKLKQFLIDNPGNYNLDVNFFVASVTLSVI